ncbi:chemotaxis protein CheB [Azospirillum sp. TSO22-1]|uniref:chemotaxis protein CheB n=1 Tax=Azospirillum sp. TSO22-1 TaxID=716789 RepID=UPI000D60B77B|nr:chemotaxis protein CheB [Azospirillum sp. TSO22-1]PWC42336.1 glutamate methylesterase [Azospirillum sp. TSO22-1]
MTPPSKVKVLIVEDSPVVQQLLAHIVGGDPRLEVAGVASTGEEALRVVERARPDVVSLDIRLPGIDGFEVTKRLMRQHPVPIVVVAADVNDLNIPMRALQAGALAVVEKPVGFGRADYQAVARHLCTQLHGMSQVKVIRQRAERFAVRPRIGAPTPCAAAPARPPGGRYTALGLVASTGGPPALVKVLSGLPKAFPLPIFLVQHIGAPFVAGFAQWLETVCPFPVELGRTGARPLPGRVYVAPGDAHMTVEHGAIRLAGDAPVCGQRPSGDVLFSSLATAYGVGAMGVLLTGMGEDGARGLLDMRRAGSYTIAEHASTAVIHSMPGTAVRLGAAVEELPLPQVAPRLVALTLQQMEGV